MYIGEANEIMDRYNQQHGIEVELPQSIVLEGWYLLHYEGTEWVAVKIEHSGELTAYIDYSSMDSHNASGDRFADVCDAIRDRNTVNVSEPVASLVREIYAEWSGREVDADTVRVKRIAFNYW